MLLVCRLLLLLEFRLMYNSAKESKNSPSSAESSQSSDSSASSTSVAWWERYTFEELWLYMQLRLNEHVTEIEGIIEPLCNLHKSEVYQACRAFVKHLEHVRVFIDEIQVLSGKRANEFISESMSQVPRDLFSRILHSSKDMRGTSVFVAGTALRLHECLDLAYSVVGKPE